MENNKRKRLPNKNTKYYNPYPFAVRVLNDLGEPYVMEPQDYCKILNKKYTQSALSLPQLIAERVYKIGLDIILDDLKKQELVQLAWALCIDGIDDKETKITLIGIIKEKIGSDYSLTKEEIDKSKERESEEQELIEKEDV